MPSRTADRGEAAADSLTLATEDVARADRLLVVTDFDGTLAPIVDDPADATALPVGLAAVAELSSLPRTVAAVMSGRGFDDLRERCHLPRSVVLIGSHGAELGRAWEDGETATALRAIADCVHTSGVLGPRSFVEIKPTAVSVHLRGDDEVHAPDRLSRLAVGLPGVHLRHGHRVVELTLVDADKGRGLDWLRHESRADRTVFLGDDHTDEDAFGVLQDSDVGIKVGDGPTRAGYRLGDPDEVATFLTRLALLRRAAVTGGDEVPE